MPARRTFSRWRLAAALGAAGLAMAATAAQAQAQLVDGRGTAASPADNPAGLDWQPVGALQVARTETTVAQFQRFVQATGTSTQAERQGGGSVYQAGWVQQPGWTWRTPMGGGQAAHGDEPAVHLNFHEAQAFCRWAGGRLPTDAEWTDAAYLEQRPAPPTPWVSGRRYAFPLGDQPTGAQCLTDCGPAAACRAVAHGARLWQGQGPARVSTTPAGVNGLHDMGGNVWEWVDEPRQAAPGTERRTRGGSWWYGAEQMRERHLQSKPPETTVVYIGFRCVRP